MGTLTAMNLTCAFRNRLVFADVSIAIRPGELLALIGPNGAGKSTLLRTLAGLNRPTAGAITLDGIDLNRWSRSEVARALAFTPQGLLPDWPFRVREFVALGRAPHCGWLGPLRFDDQKAIEASLARLGLTDLSDRPITELSGGEWQRVRLARALAQQPRVLLLDEPTAHLDPRHQVDFLTAVRTLTREEGVAVVLSMHDLNLAGPWADGVALLAGGGLLAAGSPPEVLTPEILEAAYNIRLAVAPHPLTGAPAVAHENGGKRGHSTF